MRLTVAVLGIATTSFWGCNVSPPVQSLEETIASIRKSRDGKLRPEEYKLLGQYDYFSIIDESERRHLQKVLNALYTDKGKVGKKAISPESIRADIAKLNPSRSAPGLVGAAKAIAADYDGLSDEDKYRLKKFLATQIEWQELQAAMNKEFASLVDNILEKFNGKLLLFEMETLKSLRLQGIRSRTFAQFITNLLGDIYGDTPKFEPVTIPEFRAMLEKTRNKVYIPLRDEAEGHLIGALYSATPEQRIRVKGWLKYYDYLLTLVPSK